MTARDGYADSYSGRPHDSYSGRTHGAYGRDQQPSAPGVTPASSARVTLTLGGAIVLLLLVGATGAAVDLLLGAHLDVGTLVMLPVGAFLAALLVRRRGLFLVVVAPPLAYLVLTGLALVVSGTGLGLTGLAAGVVFGFPTMAVATLLAVIVAGLRQVTGR